MTKEELQSLVDEQENLLDSVSEALRAGEVEQAERLLDDYLDDEEDDDEDNDAVDEDDDEEEEEDDDLDNVDVEEEEE